MPRTHRGCFTYRGDVRLAPIALAGVAAVCCAACGLSSSAPAKPEGATGPTNGPSSTAITVTTATDCAAMPSGIGSLSWWTLDNADGGNTYLMSRCQALGVELEHSAADGCAWSTVTSSSAALTLLPLPLPAPPPGGTFEVYGAVSPGQAQLTSALTCPGGVVDQTWSVNVDVGG